MARVLAQAAEHGRKATVTAVERAHDQAATAKRTRAASSGKDPDQAIQRLRRENQDLRRLVKIYAESIRQLTLDHLELETKLHAAADIAVLPSHRSR